MAINLKNLIRIGRVSSINYTSGMVRVCIADQDAIVTDELPMLAHEYEMPCVGDLVVCLFLGTGNESGFCLGRYFYDEETPVESGENIFFKRFLKEAYLKYDKKAKNLILCADCLTFDGDVSITGRLTVTGDTSVGGSLSVSGSATISKDATIGGKSFLNHTHSGVKSGEATTGVVV